MKLIFEKGTPGRHCHLLPDCDVPVHQIGVGRKEKLNLPELSENEISRHYTGLAGRAHGVNNGFYPLGSCTMKYNPKVNEEAASLERDKFYPIISFIKTLSKKVKENKLCQVYLNDVRPK